MDTATAPIPVRSPLPDGLAGSTVVILGGTSGIGLAAGAMLRSVGARVVLVGRNKGRLDAAVERVGGGDQVIGETADVADLDALEGIFERAGSVDHVLVTAGVIGGPTPVTEVTRDGAWEDFQSRLWGVLATARVAASRLPVGGSITFTSGTLLMRPIPGFAGTIAAAGGVEPLSRQLAVELAPRRLRVNTVRYGVIDTPLARTVAGAGPDTEGDEKMAQAALATPLGRYGTADEAAAAAVFVMANPYVTGSILTIDGGGSLA
ncbi:SDR family oxidoreductase [Actinomadura barringtoniae]|uniref:SDR family oxidoreductase n=1 Tax=Actinomadura barringtoniae TaxID=1427535 RepID=A0A939P9Q1_9ACTN|nr:SDR family oxidoreductase [Actinomadura barringtoniae]MBO2445544.1 SDR family oxidoreductase [Actinomadura barringtoniae]